MADVAHPGTERNARPEGDERGRYHGGRVRLHKNNLRVVLRHEDDLRIRRLDHHHL
jgi:hypothetical protein